MINTQMDNKTQLSKQEIREIQKTKRDQYTNEMRDILNKRVRNLSIHLFNHLENMAGFAGRNKENKLNVFIYLSSYEKVEVDTWKIISDLLKKDKYSVYVPKIVGNCIIPVKYTNHFTRNRFGVFECINSADQDGGGEIIPDIIITPLLAYSINGDRIGYGKGFYDRYLARVKNEKPCITVGLSFENHTNNMWQVEEHDISLDYVISATKIYEF